MEKKIPQIESRLRHNILEIPKAAYKASGILIYGKRIKTLVLNIMDSPHLLCSLHETGADFLFLQRKISKKDEVKK